MDTRLNLPFLFVMLVSTLLVRLTWLRRPTPFVPASSPSPFNLELFLSPLAYVCGSPAPDLVCAQNALIRRAVFPLANEALLAC